MWSRQYQIRTAIRERGQIPSKAGQDHRLQRNSIFCGQGSRCDCVCQASGRITRYRWDGVSGIDTGLIKEKEVRDEIFEKALMNSRERAEKTLQTMGM